MSEEYLWDRSGEPDAEVERLEKLLSPMRFPAGRKPQMVASRGRWIWGVAAAAALLAIGAFEWGRMTPTTGEKTSWHAVRMAGAPRVNGRTVSDSSNILTGQRIETDASSRVEVRSDFIGQVQLDPNSELYVKESAADRQLLSLRRGVLHALIWAPPSQFAVDTPGARAVDLGCAYTLQTQVNGDGLLTVQLGWVAFDNQRKESFIPAQAACRIHAKSGPGIPWFEDATSDFRSALFRLEERETPESLHATLATARPRDALSLWHLLSRLAADERGIVFDRFASLVKLPSSVQKAAVIAGDRHSLDECWDALQLGDTSWWRTWKRPF